MVIRVYNVDKEMTPDFTAYIDPWALYISRELDFQAHDNYSITPKNQGT